MLNFSSSTVAGRPGHVHKAPTVAIGTVAQKLDLSCGPRLVTALLVAVGWALDEVGRAALSEIDDVVLGRVGGAVIRLEPAEGAMGERWSDNDDHQRYRARGLGRRLWPATRRQQQSSWSTRYTGFN